MRQVKIYDTTLRDGTQAEYFSLSLADKIRIARKLAQFGVHYIEGGWPGSNPKDRDFFEEIRQYGELNGSRIAAFGSTHHKDRPPESDPVFQELLLSRARWSPSSGNPPSSRQRRSCRPPRSATWNSSAIP